MREVHDKSEKRESEIRKWFKKNQWYIGFIVIVLLFVAGSLDQFILRKNYWDDIYDCKRTCYQKGECRVPEMVCFANYIGSPPNITNYTCHHNLDRVTGETIYANCIPHEIRRAK